MKFNYGSFYKQDYGLGYIQENIEMVMYTAVCFLVPFMMGHPQLFVGIVVNCALVLAALNLKSYKMLPIILIPSIAVLMRGAIFGPFTMFLIYMIPVIWIGNTILVVAIKELSLKRKWNKFLSLGIGSAVKAGFIFIGAFVMLGFGLIPAALLGAMGILQLTTALIGGGVAIGIHEMKKKYV